MPAENRKLPKWILVASALIALLEIMISITLVFSPQSVVEEVDLKADGVAYLVYLWAARQFALGIIFGYATMKRSVPMLTLAYVFFLVMMIGDLLIGILQQNNNLALTALVMSVISASLIIAINRKK